MDKEENPGTWIGVGIAGAMLLVSVLSCLVTGFAAAQMSESDSVSLSYFTVPLIAVGLLAWIPALITRKKGNAAAIGAPLGCGCLTWVFSAISLFVFFEVLWPSL